MKKWQDKYYECLALEFSDPQYFEAHHLLVLTYMLQTNAYSEESFLFARDLLKKFLNHSITTTEFRRQFKHFGSFQNIIKKTNKHELEKFDWNLNILSLRTDTAEHYCQDVEVWAKDVARITDETMMNS